MYGTLRTWAAWTVGRVAEKTEDLADALHFVADFLEYEVGGIEALRADWPGSGGVVRTALGDFLCSNEEPAVNIRDQKRLAELRENEGRAIDYGSLGWPKPGDEYEPGNGNWWDVYRTGLAGLGLASETPEAVKSEAADPLPSPLGAPDPVGDLQRMFVAVDAAPYPPREQVLRLRFVKRDDGAYDLETDLVDADDGETGMEDADS